MFHSILHLQDAGQGGSEVKFQNWPQTLILQLIPKDLAQTIGSHFFKNSKSVLFHPEPSESLEALTKTLSSGYAGCVHFTGMFDLMHKQVNKLLYVNSRWYTFLNLSSLRSWGSPV